jgi:hypothetical protein
VSGVDRVSRVSRASGSRAGAFALAVAASVLAFSCVDLFHGTDFDTLCTRDPANAQCGGDAAPAADVADTGAPPVDLCSLGGDPARRAQHACGWLGACEGPKDSSRFGPCYVQALLAYDCTANPALRPRGALADLWGCLGDVKTCDDVDRCVFGGPVPSCKDVASGSFTSCTPNGNVRVQCAAPGGGRPAAVEPCALDGRGCTVLDSSRSACTAAKNSTCPAGFSGCTGSSASRCVRSGADDLDLGIDCASYGAGSCVSGTQPVCSPSTTSTACSGVEGKLGCNGTVAHVCADQRDITIDCGRFGLGCDATNASAAVPWSACTPADDATAPCTDEDTCSGTVLKSCALGRFQTLDCADVGLGVCVVPPSGAAACSKP